MSRNIIGFFRARWRALLISLLISLMLVFWIQSIPSLANRPSLQHANSVINRQPPTIPDDLTRFISSEGFAISKDGTVFPKPKTKQTTQPKNLPASSWSYNPTPPQLLSEPAAKQWINDTHTAIITDLYQPKIVLPRH